MSNKKNIWHKFAGKGYYIALILCAIAIGISGYLYYRNLDEDDAQLRDPAVDAIQGDPDVPVVATGPSDPSTQPTTQPLKTGMPVSGETVMQHCMDRLTYDPTTRDWRVHDGIDIAAETGTPVTAAADGVVYTTYHDDAMGTTVVISHAGGYMTTYASLDPELEVSAGDQVTLGQTIGHVGSSALMETAIGDHVHFSVTLEDVSVDPADFLAQ